MYMCILNRPSPQIYRIISFGMTTGRGYWATKHLLEHGHRKILTIRSNDPELKMYDDRTAGYMEAMEEYDAEPAVLTARMDFESQKEFVKTEY